MVPLAPTLPPPSRLSVAVVPEGVQIWASAQPGPAGVSFACHLYRRTLGAQQEMDLGELSAHQMGRASRMEFLDRNVEWEKTYLYKIAAVTVETVQGKEEQVQGDDSPEVQVFVHDVFPPAPPTGLQAVYSATPQQPFIDLSWTPNTESDLAGYNVYRHEEGAEPVKINTELVKAPTFREPAVQVGRRYLYSVTAVDLRGNESGKSGEAAETVQQ
jgi:fibronectin type 3 domain-containing protein